ncbi:MAG TPA: fumarylacetoacetate hydrolase family protein [Chloroflexota bacterium]|jgi:2-keto-4-pentenoate hydratase
MPDREIESIVEHFWQSRQRGVYFPPEWFDRLSLEDGYAVQLGLLARRLTAGARLIGWKVGLTSLAMQEQFRVPEPLFGYMLDDAPHPSGTRFEAARLIAPGVENELCLRLGQDLTGPGVDDATARAAVAGVCPALELAETRGDFTGQLAVAIADNIQQRYIVLGPETRPLPPALDLAAVQARVEINGETVATASGSAVLGQPLRSLVWLANKVVQYGHRLRAGDLVMTGSLTRQFPLAAGTHVRTTIAPLGTVEAHFD